MSRSLLKPVPKPDAAESSVTPPSLDSGRPQDRYGPDTASRSTHVSVVGVLLAVTPFLMIPLAHLASNPETATGMFHYELPYYVANGRAVLERGHGLLYPNPYDPSEEAPAIYFHWLPELLGAAVVQGHIDPGMLMVGLTIVAAILLAVVTDRLIRVCLPGRAGSDPLPLLAAMWGGGGLVLAGVVLQTLTGPSDRGLLSLDPGNGMWFLNWGRNALFPTEAVYHALVALCWMAEIRGRPFPATGWLLLLATTHPWSGLELLLTICTWRGLVLWLHRRRSDWLHLLTAAGLLIVFLAYYRWWLPSFPSHAALQRVWELDWSLPGLSAAAAWGPVACLAGIRLATERGVLHRRSVRFLLCALTIALLLSLHDRFMRPVQPLHFTRGYVWMPLFLLGAPVLLKGIRTLWGRGGIRRTAAVLLCLLFTTDNVVFSLVHSQRQLHRLDGFHLDLHERALLAQLHGRYADRIVLTDSLKLNYLLPAWTDLRPWLGHQFNTPDFPRRRRIMDQCFPDGTIVVDRIPDEVTLLVLNRRRNASPLAASGRWIDGSPANAEWVVWIRTAP